MPANRIMHGPLVRRALLLALAAALLAGAPAGCGGSGGGGGGGGGSTTAAEKERDVKLLNEVLGRQLAVVRSYQRVLPALHGTDLEAAQQFRAQEQEHADATTKTLRGLGATAEPAEETIEASDLKTRGDVLEFLYEMESATIDFELSTVGKLTAGSPRPLIASMAANQAERLVLLRQALGAKKLEAIPAAFETGELPAPERTNGK
ncbi:MAG TPA: ferritin-like domain-containing protein [Solirubrobacterales bacterium]|nr:ferritin-like domain-containing protein [Solirubrobacterales bacterium]